jgi:hypothetical protein
VTDRFWANVVVTALLDDNERLLGFSAIIRDLTSKQAEELQILTKTQRPGCRADSGAGADDEQREQLQDQLLQSQKMESVGTRPAALRIPIISNLILATRRPSSGMQTNPTGLVRRRGQRR